MKMAAKSLPEDDEDDSWVEAEINRELEGLTIDMDALDDANTDEETDHDVTVEGENFPKEVHQYPELDSKHEFWHGQISDQWILNFLGFTCRNSML